MSGPDEQWRPGAVAGEYRLLRRLGTGGMGRSTWRSTCRLLGR